MAAAAPAMRAGLVLVAFLLLAASGAGARAEGALPRFAEAPEYRNGEGCPAAVAGAGVCDPGLVHIAMTLDAHYLRGSMAAIYSLLNYARNYLADLLPKCVPRAIYLDSDVLAVDDVRRLWETRLPAAAVVAAPEYCHANFSRYFTDAFWSDPDLGARVFAGRRRAPCYFNTGVMVIDLRRWRSGNYRHRVEQWMELQKEKRIYELGSLPPFLLLFAGEVEAVDHRWNQHGLGGDNILGSCRPLHKGPVSLMHWSGKGKPWDRLDAGRPCPLDHTWKSYDLYIGDGDASQASAPSWASLSSSALPAAVFSW
ncbi:unnamed protein product [Triticum turgidum subsp. durum]|uniref:Hexosyltransferase n=1 Tax=Triticum turgidum subsp. durum TaxID=4567 RepID=A0A9R1B2Z7_TRITD|nr:unnamed protein product [Triticum turgidum subsp. durum]